MSWAAIAIMAAVAYVVVVTFVLALLRAAKAGDEMHEAPQAAAGEPRRFVRTEELQRMPEDAEFLQRLGRR